VAAGRSHREIATALAIDAGTPSDVAGRARKVGIDSWGAVEALSDDELDRKLYYEPPSLLAKPRLRPDPTMIDIELRRHGVTLRLLHEDLCGGRPEPPTKGRPYRDRKGRSQSRQRPRTPGGPGLSYVVGNWLPATPTRWAMTAPVAKYATVAAVASPAIAVHTT
jgi:hypothetical protein